MRTSGTPGTGSHRTPALVAVAHGTRDPAGPGVIGDLLHEVRGRLPGVDVIGAWVELVSPGIDEVMSALGRPSVVVPLLLSNGYHVATDVPAASALSAAPVHIAAPLGPARHLARAMTHRLREAGAVWGDAVVLAAAGSTDPAGLADVERAAELLRSEWGPWVSYACLSGVGPDLATAVELQREAGAGRVCVAPYLLAPGRFSHQVRDLSVAAGVKTVAPVIGRHRLLADLVLRRYRAGVRALTVSRSQTA
jgi:sirohydrochlorin ferrochelatase